MIWNHENAPRVTYKATPVEQVRPGDTLVIQGAIIREDGSHKMTILRRHVRSTGVVLVMDNGDNNFYEFGTMVCKGVTF